MLRQANSLLLHSTILSLCHFKQTTRPPALVFLHDQLKAQIVTTRRRNGEWTRTANEPSPTATNPGSRRRGRNHADADMLACAPARAKGGHRDVSTIQSGDRKQGPRCDTRFAKAENVVQAE